MRTYEYVCKSCGAKAELDRLPKDGGAFRHMVDGRICGTFRRDWSSINVNRVPGGGRD